MDLIALYENLQFPDITTFIQSGNVIFKSNEKLSDIEFAKKIEEAIYKQFGFEVPVIVRSKDEMKQIISANPFLKEENIDAKKLHLTLLSEIPDKKNVESIEKLDFAPDKFLIRGKEIYLYITNSYGETKISNNFFEKKLKVKATTRNWNTIYKLSEMAFQQINK